MVKIQQKFKIRRTQYATVIKSTVWPVLHIQSLYANSQLTTVASRSVTTMESLIPLAISDYNSFPCFYGERGIIFTLIPY